MKSHFSSIVASQLFGAEKQFGTANPPRGFSFPLLSVGRIQARLGIVITNSLAPGAGFTQVGRVGALPPWLAVLSLFTQGVFFLVPKGQRYCFYFQMEPCMSN